MNWLRKLTEAIAYLPPAVQNKMAEGISGAFNDYWAAQGKPEGSAEAYFASHPEERAQVMAAPASDFLPWLNNYKLDLNPIYHYGEVDPQTGRGKLTGRISDEYLSAFQGTAQEVRTGLAPENLELLREYFGDETAKALLPGQTIGSISELLSRSAYGAQLFNAIEAGKTDDLDVDQIINRANSGYLGVVERLPGYVPDKGSFINWATHKAGQGAMTREEREELEQHPFNTISTEAVMDAGEGFSDQLDADVSRSELSLGEYGLGDIRDPLGEDELNQRRSWVEIENQGRTAFTRYAQEGQSLNRQVRVNRYIDDGLDNFGMGRPTSQGYDANGNLQSLQNEPRLGRPRLERSVTLDRAEFQKRLAWDRIHRQRRIERQEAHAAQFDQGLGRSHEEIYKKGAAILNSNAAEIPTDLFLNQDPNSQRDRWAGLGGTVAGQGPLRQVAIAPEKAAQIAGYRPMSNRTQEQLRRLDNQFLASRPTITGTFVGGVQKSGEIQFHMTDRNQYRHNQLLQIRSGEDTYFVQSIGRPYKGQWIDGEYTAKMKYVMLGKPGQDIAATAPRGIAQQFPSRILRSSAQNLGEGLIGGGPVGMPDNNDAGLEELDALHGENPTAMPALHSEATLGDPSDSREANYRRALARLAPVVSGETVSLDFSDKFGDTSRLLLPEEMERLQRSEGPVRHTVFGGLLSVTDQDAKAPAADLNAMRTNRLKGMDRIRQELIQVDTNRVTLDTAAGWWIQDGRVMRSDEQLAGTARAMQDYETQLANRVYHSMVGAHYPDAPDARGVTYTAQGLNVPNLSNATLVDQAGPYAAYDLPVMQQQTAEVIPNGQPDYFPGKPGQKPAKYIPLTEPASSSEFHYALAEIGSIPQRRANWEKVQNAQGEMVWRQAPLYRRSFDEAPPNLPTSEDLGYEPVTEERRVRTEPYAAPAVGQAEIPSLEMNYAYKGDHAPRRSLRSQTTFDAGLTPRAMITPTFASESARQIFDDPESRPYGPLTREEQGALETRRIMDEMPWERTETTRRDRDSIQKMRSLRRGDLFRQIGAKGETHLMRVTRPAQQIDIWGTLNNPEALQEWSLREGCSVESARAIMGGWIENEKKKVRSANYTAWAMQYEPYFGEDPTANISTGEEATPSKALSDEIPQTPEPKQPAQYEQVVTGYKVSADLDDPGKDNVQMYAEEDKFYDGGSGFYATENQARVAAEEHREKQINSVFAAAGSPMALQQAVGRRMRRGYVGDNVARDLGPRDEAVAGNTNKAGLRAVENAGRGQANPFWRKLAALRAETAGVKGAGTIGKSLAVSLLDLNEKQAAAQHYTNVLQTGFIAAKMDNETANVQLFTGQFKPVGIDADKPAFYNPDDQTAYLTENFFNDELMTGLRDASGEEISLSEFRERVVMHEGGHQVSTNERVQKITSMLYQSKAPRQLDALIANMPGATRDEKVRAYAAEVDAETLPLRGGYGSKTIKDAFDYADRERILKLSREGQRVNGRLYAYDGGEDLPTGDLPMSEDHEERQLRGTRTVPKEQGDWLMQQQAAAQARKEKQRAKALKQAEYTARLQSNIDINAPAKAGVYGDMPRHAEKAYRQAGADLLQELHAQVETPRKENVGDDFNPDEEFARKDYKEDSGLWWPAARKEGFKHSDVLGNALARIAKGIKPKGVKYADEAERLVERRLDGGLGAGMPADPGYLMWAGDQQGATGAFREWMDLYAKEIPDGNFYEFMSEMLGDDDNFNQLFQLAFPDNETPEPLAGGATSTEVQPREPVAVEWKRSDPPGKNKSARAASGLSHSSYQREVLHSLGYTDEQLDEMSPLDMVRALEDELTKDGEERPMPKTNKQKPQAKAQAAAAPRKPQLTIDPAGQAKAQQSSTGPTVTPAMKARAMLAQMGASNQKIAEASDEDVFNSIRTFVEDGGRPRGWVDQQSEEDLISLAQAQLDKINGGRQSTNVPRSEDKPTPAPKSLRDTISGVLENAPGPVNVFAQDTPPGRATGNIIAGDESFPNGFIEIEELDEEGGISLVPLDEIDRLMDVEKGGILWDRKADQKSRIKWQKENQPAAPTPQVAGGNGNGKPPKPPKPPADTASGGKEKPEEPEKGKGKKGAANAQNANANKAKASSVKRDAQGRIIADTSKVQTVGAAWNAAPLGAGTPKLSARDQFIQRVQKQHPGVEAEDVGAIYDAGAAMYEQDGKSAGDFASHYFGEMPKQEPQAPEGRPGWDDWENFDVKYTEPKTERPDWDDWEAVDPEKFGMKEVHAWGSSEGRTRPHGDKRGGHIPGRAGGRATAIEDAAGRKRVAEAKAQQETRKANQRPAPQRDVAWARRILMDSGMTVKEIDELTDGQIVAQAMATRGVGGPRGVSSSRPMWMKGLDNLSDRIDNPEFERNYTASLDPEELEGKPAPGTKASREAVSNAGQKILDRYIAAPDSIPGTAEEMLGELLEEPVFSANVEVAKDLAEELVKKKDKLETYAKRAGRTTDQRMKRLFGETEAQKLVNQNRLAAATEKDVPGEGQDPAAWIQQKAYDQIDALRNDPKNFPATREEIRKRLEQDPTFAANTTLINPASEILLDERNRLMGAGDWAGRTRMSQTKWTGAKVSESLLRGGQFGLAAQSFARVENHGLGQVRWTDGHGHDVQKDQAAAAEFNYTDDQGNTKTTLSEQQSRDVLSKVGAAADIAASGPLPDSPQAMLKTLKERMTSHIRQWVDGMVKQVESNPEATPEERRKAIDTRERIMKVAERVIDERIGQLEQDMAGDVETKDWRGVQAGKLRTAQEIEAIASTSPRLQHEILDRFGSYQAAAVGPSTIWEDQGSYYQTGFGDQGREGGGRGFGFGGDRDKWGGGAGSALYGAYIAKRMLAMTVGPSLQEAEYYGGKIMQPGAMMAAGSGSIGDITATAGGTAVRAGLTKDIMAKGAWEQWGGFHDATYAFASRYPGAARGLSGIGAGMGIAGLGALAGSGLAETMGLGAIGGAIAPLLIGAGIGVVGGTLAMEAYNAIAPEDAEKMSWGYLARDVSVTGSVLGARKEYWQDKKQQMGPRGRFMWAEGLASVAPESPVGRVLSWMGATVPKDDELTQYMSPQEQALYKLHKEGTPEEMKAVLRIAEGAKGITGEEVAQVAPGVRDLSRLVGQLGPREAQMTAMLTEGWGRYGMSYNEQVTRFNQATTQLGYRYGEAGAAFDQYLSMSEDERVRFGERAERVAQYSGSISGYFEDPKRGQRITDLYGLTTQPEMQAVSQLMGAATQFGKTGDSVVSYTLGPGRRAQEYTLADEVVAQAKAYGTYRSGLATTLTTELGSMSVDEVTAMGALGRWGIMNQTQLQGAMSWTQNMQLFGSTANPDQMVGASMRQNPWQTQVLGGMAQQLAIQGNYDVGAAQIALSGLGMTNRQLWMTQRMIGGDLGAWSYNARETGNAYGLFQSDYGAPIWQSSLQDYFKFSTAQAAAGNKYAVDYSGKSPKQAATELFGMELDDEAMEAWLSDDSYVNRTRLHGRRMRGFQNRQLELQDAQITNDWAYTQQQWGLQDEQRTHSYNSQMTSFAVQGQRLQAQNYFAEQQEALSMTRLTEGRGFQLRQQDITAREMAVNNQYQDANMALSWNKMMSNNEFAIRGEELSWKGIEMAEKYQGQIAQIGRQRMLMQHENQLWGLQFGHETSLLQQGWQRQDWGYEDQTRALNYGWQTEDLNEAIRYATGRERRQLIRQRDRQTMTHNLEEGQVQTQRERQEQLWQREDIRYKKEEEFLNKIIELDKQQYEIGEAQRLESIELQKEEWHLRKEQREANLEFSIEDFELNKEHILEIRALNLENFTLQVEQSKRFYELDMEGLNLAIHMRNYFWALDDYELHRHMRDYQIAWDIETRRIEADRAHQTFMHNQALANLNLAKEQTKETQGYEIELEKISTQYGKIAGFAQTTIQNDPSAIFKAFSEVLGSANTLTPEGLEAMSGMLRQAGETSKSMNGNASEAFNAIGQLAQNIQNVSPTTLDALQRVMQSIQGLSPYTLDQLTEAIIAMK